MEEVKHPNQISIDSYDYPLPDERIAQFPLDIRDRSKLLISKNGEVSADIFSNMPGYLPADSTIIFNETRVIHARLLFQKKSGAPVEIFCLEPLAPFRDHQQAFQQKIFSEWLCLVG
ncbi:MAG: S-adenosylmethionine:tRNA ribosyltransferase-isomerase, partial [Bacteroidales bacterium]|nr:S-adenosylmethionine:tRNA ribosyltransferase-isomerase [Bacteroidales bacterium]